MKTDVEQAAGPICLHVNLQKQARRKLSFLGYTYDYPQLSTTCVNPVIYFARTVKSIKGLSSDVQMRLGNSRSRNPHILKLLGLRNTAQHVCITDQAI